MVKQQTNSHSQGIMVDLDSILDTRHGTIKKHYPKVFHKLRNAPKYYLRKTDTWENLDPDINPVSLALWYQGRDVETIKNSQLTMITRVIIDLVAELISKIRSNDPNVAMFFFVINVYPYKLSVELINQIASKFLTQLGLPDAPIGFINEPFKNITPSFLKTENIRFWYCYHYELWLRDNFEPVGGKEPSSTDKLSGAPDTKMFAPMICQNQKGVQALMDDLEEKIFVDNFVLTRVIFRNLINLEFLPVSSFSTIDVEKLIQLERNSDMEKSEILSTAQTAIKEIMIRKGRQPHISSIAVNTQLDEMEQLIYELRISNTEPTINIFKKNLALLNIALMQTYNHTPFSSGLDLEAAMNTMSLSVDTNEEEYLATEKVWNDQGIPTIKQVVDLENGETLYRCIVASGDKQGQLLEPAFKPEITVPAADFIALDGYFR